ncbi:MAG: adenylate/guanylate cyclase domain-containing protein [Candidatus Xenobia bacterium]
MVDERADEFEEQRRARETRNELVINYLRGGMVSIAFIAHLANHLFGAAPFPSPLSVVLILGTAVVFSIGLHLYLRRRPAYHPWRPYLIAAVEGGMVAAALFNLIQVLPPALRWIVPLPLLLMLIIVSGLRYSTRVVGFAGLLEIVLYEVLFAPAAPGGYRYVAAGFGPVLMTVAAIAIGYNVASLLDLHRESVWKERFSRFLAPELVDELARNPEVLQQKTEHRTATVLFTDIRGFTTLSERLTPDEVVAFLNLFLDEMTQAIMSHQGMVDKYIGDCVLGVFGVPLAHDGHADQALQSALAMKERLVKLNQTLAERNLPQLGIGIGIHTGDLLVGAIGSRHRLEYTVIGDTVNVASRIETLTRQYPADILFSQATRDALQSSFPAREVASVQVKGRTEPVTLWAPA